MEPAGTRGSPAAHSSPRRRMSVPAATEAPVSSGSPVRASSGYSRWPCRAVSSRPCSLRSTASVPMGIAAPVAMAAAVPNSSRTDGSSPARTPSPTMCQGLDPATAKPSMAAVSKAGRSVRASMGAASAQPRQESRRAATGRRGCTAAVATRRAWSQDSAASDMPPACHCLAGRRCRGLGSRRRVGGRCHGGS